MVARFSQILPEKVSALRACMHKYLYAVRVWTQTNSEAQKSLRHAVCVDPRLGTPRMGWSEGLGGVQCCEAFNPNTHHKLLTSATFDQYCMCFRNLETRRFEFSEKSGDRIQASVVATRQGTSSSREEAANHPTQALASQKPTTHCSIQAFASKPPKTKSPKILGIKSSSEILNPRHSLGLTKLSAAVGSPDSPSAALGQSCSVGPGNMPYVLSSLWGEFTGTKHT